MSLSPARVAVTWTLLRRRVRSSFWPDRGPEPRQEIRVFPRTAKMKFIARDQIKTRMSGEVPSAGSSLSLVPACTDPGTPGGSSRRCFLARRIVRLPPGSLRNPTPGAPSVGLWKAQVQQIVQTADGAGRHELTDIHWFELGRQARAAPAAANALNLTDIENEICRIRHDVDRDGDTAAEGISLGGARAFDVATQDEVAGLGRA